MGNGPNNNEQQAGRKEQNPGGVIVLGVYIHCQGCADTVRNSLSSFDGVEGIEIDEKNHRVTVRGKKADPTMVTERLRMKSGKHVELISPVIKPKKHEQKEPKKEEPKVIEVIMKIYMHCEACAKEVKQCIHKLPGVQTVDPDMSNNIVNVKGSMSAENLVEFISKRAGRNAQILKVNKAQWGKDNNQNQNQNQNHNHNHNHGETDYYRQKAGAYKNYTPELLHAPQLFSDENPNACTIM